MAKIKTNVTTGYSANDRVYEAKHERRIEKSNYSLSQKMATVEKLRDTARSLRSATLVKPGKVVRD